jgi:predicted Zn-dependent protease
MRALRVSWMVLAVVASAGLVFVPASVLGQGATAQRADPVQVRQPGARPTPQSPEHSLWVASEDAEREAMRSAVRIEDETLRGYVRDVQCRVVPQHCADIRVQVFRRAAFNAFVMPNGYTEVWSGLMLRVRNEAQLAFVLGHEGAHFTGNHSLRQWESMKRTQGALLALSIVASAAATFDANYVDYGRYVDVLTTAAYLGALASLFSYSREFEEEADQVGQAKMARAGYDPREASKVWTTVIALDRASDSERIRRSESRGSVFRTHPLSSVRLARLEQLASTVAVGSAPAGSADAATGAPAALPQGVTEEARYRAVIRPFLMDWLRDEMRGRDYGATLALLDDLRQGGDAGIVSYFEGEVYRLRRRDGDDARAIAAYQAAAREADCPPEAFRELGTALNRNGDREGARTAFATYLERKPDAPDRALIQRQVVRLSGSAPPASPATAPASPPAAAAPPTP